jgi:hypothetical protein
MANETLHTESLALQLIGKRLFCGERVVGILESFRVDDCGKLEAVEVTDPTKLGQKGPGDSIQDLIGVARGVALIINSIHALPEDRGDCQNLLWNLATALKCAVEPADADYFGSPGELNERIPTSQRIRLLEKELEKARQAHADAEAQRLAKAKTLKRKVRAALKSLN